MKNAHITAAWPDFYSRVKNSEAWKTMSKEEKNYLNKAAWHAAKFQLGEDRFMRLVEKYAPGAYMVKSIVSTE